MTYKYRHVRHSKFGDGLIVETRNRNRKYRIKFDLGLTIWLEASTVILIDDVMLDGGENYDDLHYEGPVTQKISRREKNTINEQISMISDSLKARINIEALRLGIVGSKEAILDFTMHRKEETDFIFNNISNSPNNGGFYGIIKGQYGSGKTHFVRYLKQVAMSKGWVVATTELDEFEVAPQKPSIVYNSLMLNLEAEHNGVIKGLEDIIKDAILDEEVYSYFTRFNYHEYIGKLMGILRNSKNYNSDILWQWFTGDKIGIPYARKYIEDKGLRSIQSFFSYASHICYILNGISLLVEKLGYNGLLILLDESEMIANLTPKIQEKAENFLKGLKFISLGPEKSNISEEELSSYRSFPFSYELPSKLSVLFALTPRGIGNETFLEEMVDNQCQIELSELRSKDLKKLTKKISETYELGYDIDLNIKSNDIDQIVEYIEKDESRYSKLRLKIKLIVDLFDRMRHNRSNTLNEILDSYTEDYLLY